MKWITATWVLCALAGTAAAQVPQEAPSTHSPQPKSDPSRDKPAAQPQSASPAPVIVNVHPPAKTEAEAQKEERERQEKTNLDGRLVELTGDLAYYTKLLAWATIVLTIATAGLFAFAVLQARDAKEAGKASQRSADAAARSAELAERALGGAEPPYLYPIVQAVAVEEVPDFMPREGMQAVIGIKITNFGRSPALLQGYLTTLAPSRSVPAVEPIDGHSMMRLSAAIKEGETVMLNRVGVATGIEKCEVDGVPPQYEWPLMLHGYIVYADLAGDLYATRYCYNYVRHRKTFFALGGENKNSRYKLSAEEMADVRRVLSD